MTHKFADITFTDSVKVAQEHYGSRSNKVLGPNQLAYADFRDNTQLISTGNVSTNDRCSLILMDYPKRKRLKILGHMHINDADKVKLEIIAAVDLSDYKARIERIVIINVAAFDWNCPQHITRRYTEAEIRVR